MNKKKETLHIKTRVSTTSQSEKGMPLINVSGDNIRQGSGGSTIAKMRDVRKQIDGPGGVTLAALWYCFIC